MTIIAWNNGSYYGKKTKRYFMMLDKMIIKLFNKIGESDNLTSVNESMELILKLTGRQNTLAHTITKLVETLDTNQRLLDIEKLLNSVPPEAIARARVDVDGLTPRTS